MLSVTALNLFRIGTICDLPDIPLMYGCKEKKVEEAQIRESQNPLNRKNEICEQRSIGHQFSFPVGGVVPRSVRRAVPLFHTFADEKDEFTAQNFSKEHKAKILLKGDMTFCSCQPKDLEKHDVQRFSSLQDPFPGLSAIPEDFSMLTPQNAYPSKSNHAPGSGFQQFEPLSE